jgi:hypothetical protein
MESAYKTIDELEGMDGCKLTALIQAVMQLEAMKVKENEPYKKIMAYSFFSILKKLYSTRCVPRMYVTELSKTKCYLYYVTRADKTEASLTFCEDGYSAPPTPIPIDEIEKEINGHIAIHQRIVMCLERHILYFVNQSMSNGNNTLTFDDICFMMYVIGDRCLDYLMQMVIEKMISARHPKDETDAKLRVIAFIQLARGFFAEKHGVSTEDINVMIASEKWSVGRGNDTFLKYNFTYNGQTEKNHHYLFCDYRLLKGLENKKARTTLISQNKEQLNAITDELYQRMAKAYRLHCGWYF